MCSVLERARKYIAKCPSAVSGQGGHNATFHVASILVHGFALPECDALELLRGWNLGCVPPWSDAQLVHKVRSAAAKKSAEPRGYLLGQAPAGTTSGGKLAPLAPLPKPEFCPAVLKRVAKKTAGIRDILSFITERSPVCVDTQDSASVLRRIYRWGSGERVLIFTEMRSQGQFLWEANRSDVTQNRDLPKGADGVWFLPQPVDGNFYPNPRQDNKPSRRSEESVTAWRYAVLESDKADADDWLRCLVQMPLRIVSICESGGRSIHALVRVDAASKLDWDTRMGAIKTILIILGADRGALSAVRLSRLPQARRGERLQRLIYLNEQPIGVPILKQPTREALVSMQRRDSHE